MKQAGLFFFINTLWNWLLVLQAPKVVAAPAKKEEGEASSSATGAEEEKKEEQSKDVAPRRRATRRDNWLINHEWKCGIVLNLDSHVIESSV